MKSAFRLCKNLLIYFYFAACAFSTSSFNYKIVPSPYADVKIYDDVTIPHYVMEHWDEYGDAVALLCIFNLSLYFISTSNNFGCHLKFSVKVVMIKILLRNRSRNRSQIVPTAVVHYHTITAQIVLVLTQIAFFSPYLRCNTQSMVQEYSKYLENKSRTCVGTGMALIKRNAEKVFPF